MKTNYFFLYFFFIILAGCSDDKITPELPQIQTIRMKGFMIKSSFQMKPRTSRMEN